MRGGAAALRIVTLSVLVAAGGCQQPEPTRVTPTIRFDTVPVATTGGADRLETISGRVTGATPTQQIVLFARSGLWWVQPFKAEPFTPIAPDGTWKSQIHLGTDYAALLVEPGYRPPSTTVTVPAAGGLVIAAASTKGTSPATSPPGAVHKRLTFSGYEWNVRETQSDRGGLNLYDPEHAWTDKDGFLHLKLAQRDGRWFSAEVVLTRGLGYGTYLFVVRDVSQLDSAATLSLFTWDEEAIGEDHREMDVEISRWGDPAIANAQYVVQPYYVAANVLRFTAPPGVLTHAFRWEPGRALFSTSRGRNAAATPAAGTTSSTRLPASVVARHEFSSGVPIPGAERVRMNLYYFRYSPVPPEKDVEVVIERFQYLP